MSGSAKLLLILLAFIVLLLVSVIFLCIEPLVSAISLSLLLASTTILCLVISQDSAKGRAADIKLDKYGTTVKAWLVFGNENLFRQMPPKASYHALFIFSTDDRIPRPERELPILAKDLQEFRAASSSFEETSIEQLLQTGEGVRFPMKIPSRITGKFEVYFSVVEVKAEMLPDNSLTKKYIYCKFFKGKHREEGLVRMIPYPEEEQETDRERGRDRDGDNRRGSNSDRKDKWEDDPWDD